MVKSIKGVYGDVVSICLRNSIYLSLKINIHFICIKCTSSKHACGLHSSFAKFMAWSDAVHHHVMQWSCAPTLLPGLTLPRQLITILQSNPIPLCSALIRSDAIVTQSCLSLGVAHDKKSANIPTRSTPIHPKECSAVKGMKTCIRYLEQRRFGRDDIDRNVSTCWIWRTKYVRNMKSSNEAHSCCTIWKVACALSLALPSRAWKHLLTWATASWSRRYRSKRIHLLDVAYETREKYEIVNRGTFLLYDLQIGTQNIIGLTVEGKNTSVILRNHHTRVSYLLEWYWIASTMPERTFFPYHWLRWLLAPCSEKFFLLLCFKRLSISVQ